MSDKDEDRQGLVDFLKGHGWSEEKANEFLNDKVGVQALQIPGTCLMDVLQAVCKEGIPIGTISVEFLVPKSNWGAFKKAAEKAIGKHGGFLLTPDEKAAIGGIAPETVN